jgi:hypothetical protein
LVSLVILLAPNLISRRMDFHSDSQMESSSFASRSRGKDSRRLQQAGNDWKRVRLVAIVIRRDVLSQFEIAQQDLDILQRANEVERSRDGSNSRETSNEYLGNDYRGLRDKANDETRPTCFEDSWCCSSRSKSCRTIDEAVKLLRRMRMIILLGWRNPTKTKPVSRNEASLTLGSMTCRLMVWFTETGLSS